MLRRKARQAAARPDHLPALAVAVRFLDPCARMEDVAPSRDVALDGSIRVAERAGAGFERRIDELDAIETELARGIVRRAPIRQVRDAGVEVGPGGA